MDEPRANIESGAGAGHWTFLTNHAHVLLLIARDPETRLRDLATDVGITERSAQRIVTDLVDAGYLARERAGRRNAYRVNRDLPLRHPVEQRSRVGALLELLGEVPASGPGTAAPASP